MVNNEQSLPDFRNEYSLTSEQIASYQKNGHIMLKTVATPTEVSTYREIIIEEVQKQNKNTAPMRERNTYAKAFIQIGNLWMLNNAASRFVLARRFAKIAADLMEVDSVRLYHDQALFKEPSGGHTPWHQDQIYWPLDTDKTITMWMPLVNIPAEMGTMTFASGSHHSGYISKLVISDESHKTLKEYIENKQLKTITYGAMAAGDATFHSGWALHSAPGNSTENMRAVMTIIYYENNIRILEPDSNARRSDLNKMFPGLKGGDPAESPLTPVVYSASN